MRAASDGTVGKTQDTVTSTTAASDESVRAVGPVRRLHLPGLLHTVTNTTVVSVAIARPTQDTAINLMAVSDASVRVVDPVHRPLLHTAANMMVVSVVIARAIRDTATNLTVVNDVNVIVGDQMAQRCIRDCERARRDGFALPQWC